MQSKRLLAKSEAKYAFLVMLVIVVIGFIESCLHFYGSDVGEIPSAATAWAGNADNLQIQAMRVLYFFLIFILASSVFSDCYFVDVKSKVAQLVATRGSFPAYLASTGLLSFVGGFVVVFVPLLVSQALAFLAFPFISSPDSFSYSFNTPAFNQDAAHNVGNALFPSLLLDHPYLNNLLFIAYDSLWAGIMSLASFALSLFIRKSRLVVLVTPTIIYLASLFVVPSAGLSLPYYLYPCTVLSGLTPLFFFGAPLFVIIGLLAVIPGARAFKKDPLL
jgi:hypothetical protein